MAEKLEIIITAKDKFSRTMKSLRGMLPSIKTLAIGAGAGASALGAGLFAIANSTAKAGDEFQKMSLRLGLSTELLSGMKHAIELSGSSMEAFEKGVRTLAKRMSDADEGLVEAERSFEALGIQVKNADGSLKDLDTIMPQIAEGLATMDDNTKRVALAQELLGRSGTALLPLFKQGADGLRKMTEEARALGITFDKVGADQAAKFRDNMLRLQRVFTGIKTQIGTAIIPLMSEYMGALKEIGIRLVAEIKEHKAGIRDFAEAFIISMGEMAKIGGYTAAVIIDSWRALQITWIDLQKGLTHFVKLNIAMMTAIADARIAIYERINIKDILGKEIEGLIAISNQGEIIMANLRTKLIKFDKERKKLMAGPWVVEGVTDMVALVEGALEKLRTLDGIPPFDTENIDKTKENIDTITAYSMEGIYATRTAMINMQEDIDAAIEKSTQNFEKQMELHKTLADETARALQRNFSNLFFDVFTGDLKTIDGYFKAFTQSMLRAFSDMIAQMLIKWAVMKAAMSFGFGGGFLAGLFHEGGVAGQTKVPMRFIPMPRLHSGLRGDEFPAILQRGETVLSVDESRQAMLREQAIIINVHNELLPNVSNLAALHAINRKDMEDLVDDKIVPALRSLKLKGITV